MHTVVKRLVFYILFIMFFQAILIFSPYSELGRTKRTSWEVPGKFASTVKSEVPWKFPSTVQSEVPGEVRFDCEKRSSQGSSRGSSQEVPGKVPREVPGEVPRKFAFSQLGNFASLLLVKFPNISIVFVLTG